MTDEQQPTPDRLEVRVQLQRARLTMWVVPYRCPTCDAEGIVREDTDPADVAELTKSGQIDGSCSGCGQSLRLMRSALVGAKPQIVMPG